MLQGDGPLQHLQGVVVNVLVLVVLVDLQPQRRELGQHDVGQAGVDQQLQPFPRVVAQEQLDQLALDPFRTDDGQPPGPVPHGRDDVRGDGEPELRREAGCAQHP